jgi:hypothetical protein
MHMLVKEMKFLGFETASIKSLIEFPFKSCFGQATESELEHLAFNIKN